MTNIITLPQKTLCQRVLERIHQQKQAAEVILMLTPEHPKYSETKLQILAAHYWG